MLRNIAQLISFNVIRPIVNAHEMKLIRNETLDLKWYEGVIVVNHYKYRAYKSIIPLNLIIRCCINLCKWVKYDKL